jgi:HemX protein
MFDPATAHSLFVWGTLMYCSAVGLAVFSLVRRRPIPHSGLHLLVGLGFIGQTVALYLRGSAVGGCPTGNTFEVLQFISWSIIVVFLATGTVFRLSLLGAASATIAALLSLAAIAVPVFDNVRRSSFIGGTPWIEAHAAVAFFSYGVFGLLAAVGALYLLQNYGLRTKRQPAIFRQLPSILQLEVLLGRLLLLATAILTTSLLIGYGYMFRHGEGVSHAKLALTGVFWLLGLVTLGLRLRAVLWGARLAWAVIILFALGLLALWPVETSRPHAPPAASQSLPSPE